MSFDSSRSSNPGGKLKRGSLDMFRDVNGSNDTGIKKRKNNEKTPGMAWGCNSHSSSRSSLRSPPFSGFGSYMVVKNQKLQEQFNAEASSSSHNSSTHFVQPIFRGVSIFVDGFTVPSSQDLRSYMLKFGGNFENYFSRHRVTHIICSNLSDSKIKNLRSFSRGLPVVKPTWVLDCVGANKLLSWVSYQLDQIGIKAGNQPKLSAFFAKKNNPIEKDITANRICFVKEEIGDSSCKDDSSGDIIPHEAQEFRECSRPSSEYAGVDRFTHDDNSIVEIDMDSTCSKGIFVTQTDINDIKGEIQHNLCHPFATDSNCSENVNACSLASAKCGISKSPHTTLEDPKFVDNYFKNSRLHFIGTWKNRYRKRFSSLCNMFKSTSPKPLAVTSQSTSIIHVDMDCFFVAVVIRNRPDLQDKPVAVCHSDNPRGTSEISSANYPARTYGVRAGIFVRDAKSLCPHLVILPYNFEAYEEVADKFYEILHKHCNKVQAVSCDEAFLEVTGSEMEVSEQMASTIRREIFDVTGCTASAGVGDNMLMARLATRSAKPDGQCCIPAEKVENYMFQLPVKSLPGVGRVLEEKLKSLKIETCGQLRMISKESLQKDFGMRTGDMLWNYSRGIGSRVVEIFQQSKSVGAEVNWGVRFNNLEECKVFITNLCKEVSLRLQGSGVQGRAFTLKIKKRKKDAQEPTKFMGCGDCENLSHSMTVPVPTDVADVLQRISKQLFGFFHIDAKDIRGIGLHVSKLESTVFSPQGHGKPSLQKWLALAPKENQSMLNEGDDIGPDPEMGKLCSDLTSRSIRNGSSSSAVETSSDLLSALPPLNHLDMEVVKSLPTELFSEMNELYGGKLVDLIADNKSKIEYSSSSTKCVRLPGEKEGSTDEGTAHLFQIDSLTRKADGQEANPNEVPGLEPMGASRSESSSYSLPKGDLMPSSLSQVDRSVLQQLPKELRSDILGILPAHRQPQLPSNSAFSNQSEPSVTDTSDCVGSMDSVLNNNLWIGNPPEWVSRFKVNKCSILNILADMYFRAGDVTNLSSILQSLISESQLPLSLISDTSDEAIFNLCELLQQYIVLKLQTDLEEIYVCFRLFRRLVKKSVLPSQVYDTVFPFLQACVNDHYGGSLNISHVV